MTKPKEEEKEMKSPQEIASKWMKRWNVPWGKGHARASLAKIIKSERDEVSSLTALNNGLYEDFCNHNEEKNKLAKEIKELRKKHDQHIGFWKRDEVLLHKEIKELRKENGILKEAVDKWVATSEHLAKENERLKKDIQIADNQLDRFNIETNELRSENEQLKEKLEVLGDSDKTRKG